MNANLDDVMQKLQTYTMFTQTGNTYKCLCPFHDEQDGIEALVINGSRNLLHCFGGGQDGTVVELLAKFEENSNV